MAMTSEKIIVDPEIGEVTFRKSVRCRRISIRVHPVRGVTVTMPYVVPYAAASLFFNSKRHWVIETMARQKEKYKDVFDEIKAPYIEAVLNSVPAHLRRVKAYELQSVFHLDGWFLLHCIVTLLNNGKLKPPAEEQKKALTTIILPNC